MSPPSPSTPVVPTNSFTVALEPHRVADNGLFYATVRNNSSHSLRITLVAYDMADKLNFETDKNIVHIHTGSTATVPYKVTVQQRPLITYQPPYPFVVEARGPLGSVHHVQGELLVLPRIPRWVRFLVVLLCLLPFVFVALDVDGDQLNFITEMRVGTNPFKVDSDDDGVRDGFEDADLDGVHNLDELTINTNPTLADSDQDGVLDGDEDFDNDGIFNRDDLNPSEQDSLLPTATPPADG